MSTEYFVYTEAKINNQWICINPQTLKFNKKTREREGYVLSPTYWNGSRSYFSATFNKIKYEGSKVLFEDLSSELQKEVEEYKEDMFAYSIPTATLKKYANKKDAFECSGFVTEEDIFNYTYEHEEIYEFLTLKDYLELPEEAQKLYKAFNWNDPMGWFEKFKEISLNNDYVEYAFFEANPEISEAELRIVVFQW